MLFFHFDLFRRIKNVAFSLVFIVFSTKLTFSFLLLYCWIAWLYFAHFGTPKWTKLDHEIVQKLALMFVTFWAAKFWSILPPFWGPQIAPKITHRPRRCPWSLSCYVLVVSEPAWGPLRSPHDPFWTPGGAILDTSLAPIWAHSDPPRGNFCTSVEFHFSPFTVN